MNHGPRKKNLNRKVHLMRCWEEHGVWIKSKYKQIKIKEDLNEDERKHLKAL